MLYVLARVTEASDLQKHCDKINCTTGMLCWYSKKSKTTRTGRKTKNEGGRRRILGFGHLEKCQEAQSLHHWRCNIYLCALEHVSLHTHMHTVYQKQHRQVKDSFSDWHRDTYSPSHRHTHTNQWLVWTLAAYRYSEHLLPQQDFKKCIFVCVHIQTLTFPTIFNFLPLSFSIPTKIHTRLH